MQLNHHYDDDEGSAKNKKQISYVLIKNVFVNLIIIEIILNNLIEISISHKLKYIECISFDTLYIKE